MTLPSGSEISIYELTQGEATSPQPLKVNPAMVNSLVGAMIELLKEQRCKTTIWVKPLPNQTWSAHLEDYYNLATTEKIYLCNTSGQASGSNTVYHPKNEKIIPIELEINSKLKCEYFIVILSPEFCGAIVIQEQNKNSIKSGMNLVCTFEQHNIEKILQAIRQIIAITDKTPPEVLTESDFPFVFPFSEKTNILGQLLIKQMEKSQTNQAENKLNPTDNQLIATTDFLNTLVRELLPSITNMKTALRLLEAKQTPERRKRYMDLLQNECDRQSSLITRFQELIELDQIPLEELEIKQSLEDLVAGIISTYQPLAQEKGIQLGYTVPPGFSSVSCPAPWLRQIIINLINNSLKFTPSGGRVNVQAAKQEDSILITVTDTGVGIPAQDQNKIFNSFYRGKPHDNENEPGAGLGLTIVKEILRRCGGEISVNSTLGKGSVFKVSIPMESR